MNTIHLADNAQYAALQEHLQAARSETASLSAELAATQQAMAYHQDGVTRENVQAYMNAGHRVSKKGMHKTTLPSNPRPNQA